MKDFQTVNLAYHEGVISDVEYIYLLAYVAADANLDEMMSTLHPHHLAMLREYVASYVRERMISINNAPVVPIATIAKLRQWFGLSQIESESAG